MNLQITNTTHSLLFVIVDGGYFKQNNADGRYSIGMRVCAVKRCNRDFVNRIASRFVSYRTQKEYICDITK